MNIKRIIREELDGFKDSTEEDWDWTEDTEATFNSDERYKVWFDRIPEGIMKDIVKEIPNIIDIDARFLNFLQVKGFDSLFFHHNQNGWNIKSLGCEKIYSGKNGCSQHGFVPKEKIEKDKILYKAMTDYEELPWNLFIKLG